MLDTPLGAFYNGLQSAGIAQLVERLLPKQNVAGSNPTARSVQRRPFGVVFHARIDLQPWSMFAIDTRHFVSRVDTVELSYDVWSIYAIIEGADNRDY